MVSESVLMVQCDWQITSRALAVSTLREISSHSLILDQEMAIKTP